MKFINVRTLPCSIENAYIATKEIESRKIYPNTTRFTYCTTMTPEEVNGIKNVHVATKEI